MSFEVVSTIIFGLAILHTFLTPSLYSWSQRIAENKEAFPNNSAQWRHRHFFSEVIYLFSEVEVVFGIWLIPLLTAFTLMRGWSEALQYVNTRNYSYALYIMVMLVVIGSRPIISFAERILDWFARIGKESPAAWWWTIITVGPLLASILKEPGAMAVCAILLAKKFYPFNPSRPFAYATLGLLFANISVGGMFTTFSSRALFIVAKEWDWDMSHMISQFGWKVLIGMALANTLYYWIFHKEFQRGFPKKLPPEQKRADAQPTPFWITLVHLVLLTLIIITSESIPLFIGMFILFLGFWKATSFYQSPLHLKSGILVGFFFAGLILHGFLQGWWIIPLMSELNHFGAMGMSYLLSAFTDNAIISYLTVDIPDFDAMKRYLVISGGMSAGALTVIANAPNPIGHSILRESFGNRISFAYLFLGALIPSLIYFLLFWLLRGVSL